MPTGRWPLRSTSAAPTGAHRRRGRCPPSASPPPPTWLDGTASAPPRSRSRARSTSDGSCWRRSGSRASTGGTTTSCSPGATNGTRPAYRRRTCRSERRETASRTWAPAGSRRGPPGTAAPTQPAAAWLLLSTSSDDPLSWLRAGVALQAVWLWATLERMAVVPYSQPFEVDRTRQLLQRDLLDDSSCPQMLLRLGWPALSAAQVPRTPRRPVEEVWALGLARA